MTKRERNAGLKMLAALRSAFRAGGAELAPAILAGAEVFEKKKRGRPVGRRDAVKRNRRSKFRQFSEAQKGN